MAVGSCGTAMAAGVSLASGRLAPDLELPFRTSSYGGFLWRLDLVDFQVIFLSRSIVVVAFSCERG